MKSSLMRCCSGDSGGTCFGHLAAEAMSGGAGMARFGAAGRGGGVAAEHHVVEERRPVVLSIMRHFGRRPADARLPALRAGGAIPFDERDADIASGAQQLTRLGEILDAV